MILMPLVNRQMVHKKPLYTIKIKWEFDCWSSYKELFALKIGINDIDMQVEF